MGLRQRSAEHGEVLAEDEHQATVDRAVAGNDAIARGLLGLVHAEVGTAMLHEHVPLFEAALVEQQFDALPGRQFALGMLRVDAPLTAAELGGLAFGVETLEDVLHFFSPNLLPIGVRPRYCVVPTSCRRRGLTPPGPNYAAFFRSRISPSTSPAATGMFVPGPKTAATPASISMS